MLNIFQNSCYFDFLLVNSAPSRSHRGLEVDQACCELGGIKRSIICRDLAGFELERVVRKSTLQKSPLWLYRLDQQCIAHVFTKDAHFYQIGFLHSQHMNVIFRPYLYLLFFSMYCYKATTNHICFCVRIRVCQNSLAVRYNPSH